MNDWQKRWISGSEASVGSKFEPPAAPPSRWPVSALANVASKAWALRWSAVTWRPKWRPPAYGPSDDAYCTRQPRFVRALPQSSMYVTRNETVRSGSRRILASHAYLRATTLEETTTVLADFCSVGLRVPSSAKAWHNQHGPRSAPCFGDRSKTGASDAMKLSNCARYSGFAPSRRFASFARSLTASGPVLKYNSSPWTRRSGLLRQRRGDDGVCEPCTPPPGVSDASDDSAAGRRSAKRLGGAAARAAARMVAECIALSCESSRWQDKIKRC
mmetsp:Transcript_33224/g.100139  ORF Transcript_33224/g.100139 Transcript_33224/m.100139 type:complete len:273 (+) Transcript_33224:919-1737(+)